MKQINLKIPLYLLLLLLVFLNAVFFHIYRSSHEAEALSTQLWNYFSSDLFELTTISLLLPIIILLLESHFNVITTLMENRLRHEETIQAEQRAIINEKRQKQSEKRWEAVTATQNLMNQLFDLAIQVQCHQADSTGRVPSGRKEQDTANPNLEIKDIRRAVAQFSVSANSVVNMWFHRLSVTDEDEELFIYLLNTLLACISDTAIYIHDNDDREEVTRLQNALGIIWQQIKFAAHQPIINILKLHVRILDMGAEEMSSRELDKLNAEIDRYRVALKSWYDLIRDAEKTRNDFLPEAAGDQVILLRQALADATEFLKQNPQSGFYNFDGNQQARDAYYGVPRALKFSSLNQAYSKSFIEYLADELGFEGLAASVTERAR